MIILDTDHVSLLQWGGEGAAEILQRMEAEGVSTPTTTIITYEEQIRGWMSKLSAYVLLEMRSNCTASFQNSWPFSAP